MPITFNGSGTVTGISAGGLPDGCITTDDIATGAITQAKRSEQLTLGTAQATTSGTAIDFTGIPSWVKRITVMLNGVSTNGVSLKLVQLGISSGIVTTGYNSTGSSLSSVTPVIASSTAGFVLYSGAAADTISGALVINLVTGNTWVASGVMKNATNFTLLAAGDINLTGTLDRLRLTTANGTDTFDAGSINILYE